MTCFETSRYSNPMRPKKSMREALLLINSGTRFLIFLQSRLCA